MTTETGRLVGFCLAVRRNVFEQVGGFFEGYGVGGFEDDDLCSTIHSAGHRLLIVHDSYVHHHGHRTFTANGLDWFAIQQDNEAIYRERHGRGPWQPPFVSACLIVKDEEAMLEGCLDSIEGFADEVVIYDTGSTDRTVEIARQRGCIVIEGHWDDDFGRARNDALVHCTGEWILWVDADERLAGDVGGLRQQLTAPDAADVWNFKLANLNDANQLEMEHRALRLFRRIRGRWAGRLHEQIVPRPGQPLFSFKFIDEPWIEHLGYQTAVIEKKDKATRNVRIAELGLAEGRQAGSGRNTDKVSRLANLARSLVGAGRTEEALARCEEARRLDGLPAARCTILRQGAELLIALGRSPEALPWIEELREVSVSTDVCDFLEGSARLQMGESDRAAELLEPLGDVWDDSGQSAAPEIVQARKCLALVANGRYDDALDGLLEMVQRNPATPAWQPLYRAAIEAGRRLDEVVDATPEHMLRTICAQILVGKVEISDQAGEALWARYPDHRMIAFGVHLGPALPLERCLEWSARIRTFGLVENCCLIERARRMDVPPLERLSAAAVATGAFGDDRALEHVRSVATLLPAGSFRDAILLLDELAPSLLPCFVAAAITTTARTAAMADLLAEFGATEEADALRERMASFI